MARWRCERAVERRTGSSSKQSLRGGCEHAGLQGGNMAWAASDVPLYTVPV